VAHAPGAKPLEPFGKGSNALKAETPDAGPFGPAIGPAGGKPAWRGRPFSSRPETAKPGLYAFLPETQGVAWGAYPGRSGQQPDGAI